MISRALVVLIGKILLINTAFAAHIVTVTRQNDVLTKRTDTYANSADDLRVEERAYGSKSSSIDSAGGATPKTEYVLGNRRIRCCSRVMAMPLSLSKGMPAAR